MAFKGYRSEDGNLSALHTAVSNDVIYSRQRNGPEGSLHEERGRYKVSAVLLSLWMDLTSGQIDIQLIPQYPVIQQSVTMNVVGINRKMFSIVWYKGTITSAEHQILVYLVPGVTSTLLTGPLYVSRARPFPNGSLLISDLQITDSDNYTVRIQTERRVEQASVTLAIYAPSIPGASGCSAGVSAGVTAGIICGTVLGIVLIVSATFLLYKRCVLPVREEQRGSGRDMQ
ncbi:carcinoembryonic antigen-related cell adhesion molecule 1-like [Pseudophryne corroboree]|uniref:carcinoembryonic antigen-related cell adhesion molecule 1-like n=1 Tax=Pseudophryne corroboree TaxID=495146 RepID=UPI003081262B